MAFRSRNPPQRRDRTGEFDSYVPRPKPLARMVSTSLAMEHSPGQQKTPERKQQAIRDSARGEECTIRIPGVCAGDPERTIWSHAPLGAAGKGRGIKALDICGAYGCTACDAVVDGQAPAPAGMSRVDVLLAWCMGHLRSLVLLRQKRLV